MSGEGYGGSNFFSLKGPEGSIGVSAVGSDQIGYVSFSACSIRRTECDDSDSCVTIEQKSERFTTLGKYLDCKKLLTERAVALSIPCYDERESKEGCYNGLIVN